MKPPDPDRRRFVLATLVTLLALPALWWINQDGESAAPNVASVGVEVGDGSDGESSGEPADEPGGDETEPVFLDGPSSANGGVAEIAVPAPPDEEPIIGTASYSSIISGGTCLTNDTPPWNEVTVVNLNNNRTIKCLVAPAPESQTNDIVIHTRRYNLLADLTDAPIPVEIRP
ncbi:MAG: hypothetical protein ACR2O6_10325 [Ilumatobacteraceae bacterium]